MHSPEYLAVLLSRGARGSKEADAFLSTINPDSALVVRVELHGECRFMTRLADGRRCPRKIEEESRKHCNLGMVENDATSALPGQWLFPAGGIIWDDGNDGEPSARVTSNNFEERNGSNEPPRLLHACGPNTNGELRSRQLLLSTYVHHSTVNSIPLILLALATKEQKYAY